VASRGEGVPGGLPPHPGLEALRDGVYLLDASWRVTYWNAAAERLFGLPREAVLGRRLWDVVPGVDEGEMRERLRPAMEGRGRTEYAVVLGTGPAARHLAAEADPADGNGVVVRVRDAAREVRQAERYRRLLEAMHDGYVAVDGAWRITYVNRAARRLLAFRIPAAVGEDLRALLPKDPPAIAATLREAMRTGAPRRLSAVQPEGPAFRGRTLDVWTDPLPGGGLAILFADVTERHQRERALGRLAAEAEDASRAKSRFFAAVSHELRTPLNAIVGYTHLLQTETYGPVPPGAARAAERAAVCAEHLSRLVDDVLLMTTTELDRLPLVPRRVDPAAFLADALEPLRRQAVAKGLAFTLDLPADAPHPETDPDRLRQLVGALVSNAIKFTPRGSIRVSLREIELDRPPADVRPRGRRAAAPARGLEIAVADTGPGIAPADRERIFDPFEQLGDDSRTDSMTRGTGLGLTIARQLARLLQGTLDVTGGPGGGAVFRLRIPLALREAGG
jgi:PAS domain S-box-containing protein